MKPAPKCVDCGETDRRKFYAHPTTASGCQRRCKPCDNTKRMLSQRLSRNEAPHRFEVVNGETGYAVYLNGHRVAGPRPLHARRVVQLTADGFEIRTALRRAGEE